MAYVGTRPEEDQYKSESQSIQNQGQQQQQAGTNLNKADSAQTGGSQKQGTTSGSQTNAAPGSFTKSNFSNASQILNRNQNADTSAITGRLLGNTKQEAESQKNNYTQAANDYRTNTTKDIESKYSNFDPDKIYKALDGDTEASKALTDAYSRNTADPLKALELQKYGDINSQEFFKDGNYQPLLQKRSQGNYTSGMGAIDAALLNKSNAGQQIRNQVAGFQTGVNDAYNKAAGTTADLQTFADTRQAQQKKNLGSALTGIQSQIQSGVTSRLPDARAAAQQQAEAARTSQQSTLSARTKAAIDELLKQKDDANAKTPGYGDLLNESISKLQSANANPNSYNPYINVNTPTVGAGDVATEQERQRNKAIASILGTDDNLQSSGSQGPVASINDQGYQQLLESLKKTEGLDKFNKGNAENAASGNTQLKSTANTGWQNIKDMLGFG